MIYRFDDEPNTEPSRAAGIPFVGEMLDTDPSRQMYLTECDALRHAAGYDARCRAAGGLLSR